MSERDDMERLRQRVAATLTEARAALADLEDDNRRVRSELELVMSSKGRKAILAVRHRSGRALGMVLRPLSTVRTAFRHLTHRGPVGGLRAMAVKLLFRRTLFRSLEPVERRSNLPDVEGAVRWLGRVQISGETHDALFCHPPSSVTYEASCLGRTAVVAPCSLLPTVWNTNRGGVTCTLTVTTSDGWTATRSIRIDPRWRWRDRRWRPLTIVVPTAYAGEHRLMTTVRATLATSIPPTASLENAWAIWGDPHLRARRSMKEISTTLRNLITKVRLYGVKATIAHLREWEAADLHADLYQEWLARNAVTDRDLAAMTADLATLSYTPLISVVTPVYNTDPRWLRACIESVKRQVYPNWEMCLCDDGSTREITRTLLKEYEKDPRIRITWLQKNSHISAASNAALATATGEYVALLDHDDEYTPDALYRVVKHLDAHRDADIVYSDEDKLDLAGARCDPYFKPDWSPDQFLGCMYTPHLVVARRSLIEAAGGFRVGYEGAQDYDLFLRMSERTSRIDHLPYILYHWRKLPESAASANDAKPWALEAARRSLEDAVQRRGSGAEILPGAATGLFRVRFTVRGEPLVSIVIPTTGRPQQIGGTRIDTLRTVVRSVRQKTSYTNYEFVIVADAGEVTPEVQRALNGSNHRIVPYTVEGPFNFSHKINFGASHARGAHLLLLNDDVEVIGSEWMTAMLEYSQQPEIGAVGAKLLYTDGRLQHIGIILGVGGGAVHAFHHHAGASPGYASSAVTVRNYSAVTAACMMTRRDAFDAVSGFDERLAVDYNDVDYCLRLRSAGYRIVFTPFAVLYHHESASFGHRTQNEKEVELMRSRWGAVIARDPYYHPELTRDFADYRIRV